MYFCTFRELNYRLYVRRWFLINLYFNEFRDNNIIYSIDMAYIEYDSCFYSPSNAIEKLSTISNMYPNLNVTVKELAYSHNYAFYRHMFKVEGVTVYCGKYTNYDKLTKVFTEIPMLMLRVNPNKYLGLDWFHDLLKIIFSMVGSNGQLLKYDYAMDVPTDKSNIEIFKTRKEKGLYKGTRYYGQQGRHGYTKIYDKQADIERVFKVNIGHPLTRIETTLKVGEPLSLEEIHQFSSDVLNTDYSDLNDTDKAILDMFFQLKALGVDYDLSNRLGRKKMTKLKEYISGQYILLENGKYISLLLERLGRVFRCSTDSINHSDTFLNIDDFDNPFN